MSTPQNPNQSTDQLQALSNALADAVGRVAPAVVQVNGRPRGATSGVVYAPELVLTVAHVLEREDDLSVRTHDGRTLPAQLAGRDPGNDLAVLRVAGLGIEPAAAAPEPARVGALALAVARPSAEGEMASLGVVSLVSGPTRASLGMALEGLIRTDATPYPGFSGGALVNAQGAVLGLVNAGLVRGAVMAVPAAVAWRVAGSLAAGGSVRRGYLGVSSQPVRLPEGQRGGRAEAGGLLVVSVEPGSPAEASGALLGDVLVTFDGQAVGDAEDLQAMLIGSRVGKTVPAEVIRGGALHALSVTVGERQRATGRPWGGRRRG